MFSQKFENIFLFSVVERNESINLFQLKSISCLNKTVNKLFGKKKKTLVRKNLISTKFTLRVRRLSNVFFKNFATQNERNIVISGIKIN